MGHAQVKQITPLSNYAFLIPKLRAGTCIEAIWDGDQDYQMIVSEDGVVKVRATLTLANDLLKVVDIGLYLLVGIGILLVTWLSIFFFFRLLGG